MNNNGSLRIAVYIDGPNVNAQRYFKHIGINFKKLIKHIECIKYKRGHREGKVILRKYFYDVTGFSKSINSTADYLKNECEFAIKKVLKKRYSAQNKNLKEFKSRTDQTVTVNIMDDVFNDRFDVIVLISGDSDYEEVLKYCREKNKRVEVCFWGNSTANELREMADDFIDLDEHAFLLL